MVVVQYGATTMKRTNTQICELHTYTNLQIVNNNAWRRNLMILILDPLAGQTILWKHLSFLVFSATPNWLD